MGKIRYSLRTKWIPKANTATFTWLMLNIHRSQQHVKDVESLDKEKKCLLPLKMQVAPSKKQTKAINEEAQQLT